MKFIIQILFVFALQSALAGGNDDKIKPSVKHVSGKITTVQGQEIAGVKITIKETNETFFADLDGNFKLQIKTDKAYSISIESIGFAPLEIKSTDLSLFSNVNLQEL